jgi:hypothetical protein
MTAGFPVARVAIERTVRLVASARLRPSVLRALVPEEELEALAEIEGATSARLLGQRNGTGVIDAREFVFGVPCAAFINASFAYARPRTLNRFNGPERGAWYAALELETCIAEVGFHLARELAAVGDYHAVVEYAELFASFAGSFLDLRDLPERPACLDPDPAVGYPSGNEVAAAGRAGGQNGIIYPSVRRAGGICVVALLPQAVQSVAQGGLWRLLWDGKREPRVEEVSGAKVEGK